MRKILVAVLLGLLPLQAHAQNQPAAPTAVEAESGGGAFKTLAVTAGVITGVVVADLLTGGTLTTPILQTLGVVARPAAVAAPVARTLPPAVLEARNAGAVLGEMIVPATALRDAAARADMLFVSTLALGGVVGGWLLNKVTQ
jgi:hypothetical protein